MALLPAGSSSLWFLSERAGPGTEITAWGPAPAATTTGRDSMTNRLAPRHGVVPPSFRAGPVSWPRGGSGHSSAGDRLPDPKGWPVLNLSRTAIGIFRPLFALLESCHRGNYYIRGRDEYASEGSGLSGHHRFLILNQR